MEMAKLETGFVGQSTAAINLPFLSHKFKSCVTEEGVSLSLDRFDLNMERWSTRSWQLLCSFKSFKIMFYPQQRCDGGCTDPTLCLLTLILIPGITVLLNIESTVTK